MYQHISLDIETLGLEPGCVVLSIGMTPFNTHYTEDFDTLLTRSQHWAIDRETTNEYLVDLNTLAWHTKEPERAEHLKFLATCGRSLFTVLREVQDFVSKFSSPFIWANSPQFDCSILKYVFNREKIDCPWDFRQERDLRTALHIANIQKSNARPDTFKPHQADHDAAFQAMQIQRAFSRSD